MHNTPSDHPNPTASQPNDPFYPMQGFLLLDALARLFIWSVAVALTCALFTALHAWPPRTPVGADLGTAWAWSGFAARWIVVFNVAYVIVLLLMRLPIPCPAEGHYATTGQLRIFSRRDRQLVWACLVAIITKARYQPPFPGFLVFHVTNLVPFRWLVGPILGPRSRSIGVMEPSILDPHHVTIGRNVVIGFGATITAHVQERDGVTIRRTIIEDDVLVGGHSVVPGGAVVKSGSMIGAGAIVRPNSVIGPNEFWGGVPARKISDLPPLAPRRGRPDSKRPRGREPGTGC